MEHDPLDDATLIYQRKWEDDRDRLWCRAACEVLDIAEIAKLTKRMLELRDEKSPKDTGAR